MFQIVQRDFPGTEIVTRNRNFFMFYNQLFGSTVVTKLVLNLTMTLPKDSYAVQ